MINLAESGIKNISFWVIFVAAVVAGFLVYALGVPTKVAVEQIFSKSPSQLAMERYRMPSRETWTS
jgi:hypothetical protein